jgi:hypothetical protein
MKTWAYGIGVMIGVATLWVLSGAQHEGLVLSGRADSIRTLEAAVAANPASAEVTRRLAQAYLDARQPGLARVLLEAAPGEIRADLRIQHVLARALLDQGRSDLALDVEAGVVAACRPVDGIGPSWARASVDGLASSCDPVLFASAVRRTGVLREMVALGVTDALAHPEASLVAYENATREAHVRLE